MRASIGGGVGFFGSQFVDAPVGRGDEVMIVDDLAPIGRAVGRLGR